MIEDIIGLLIGVPIGLTIGFVIGWYDAAVKKGLVDWEKRHEGKST